jgi:hypothetical protein
MTPTHATPIDRTAINRANAKHSTGPRTESGKQRSSQNALRHGLTAETAVLPTEDPAAYQRHIQQFLDEYRPATPTETHLVQELADIAWRQNRIPLLEAELLSRGMNPPSEQARIDFDIVDAHRAIATLGMHGQRLKPPVPQDPRPAPRHPIRSPRAGEERAQGGRLPLRRT